MRFARSAVALLGLAITTNTFVPVSLPQSRPKVGMVAVDTSNDVDVSIPYDAAASFAYDEWRSQYGKGEFDQARYPNFEKNYMAVAVANVSAKKRARESGETPSLMTLNEYGDCSEEEYRAALTGESTASGNVLDSVVEAAEAQSEASSALGEAADALAEEEQVCKETL